MIRWLSQLWLSGAIDRGQKPPRLWRWTFGRLASQRAFADQLRDLDGQLRRQAASQQRALARQTMPVGRYPARTAQRTNERTKPVFGLSGWLLRPAAATALCALIAGAVWLAWPQAPTQSPPELWETASRSVTSVLDPLTRQAQTASQTLRDRAEQVSLLPEKLPAIDAVVNDLSETIQSPIREEVRRFTRDMTRPWTYLAEQLPLPLPEDREEPPAG